MKVYEMPPVFYEFDNREVEIPLSNVISLNKTIYTSVINFLNTQKELTKKTILTKSAYFQLGQIVVIESSTKENYYIAFSNKLNTEILKGLLTKLESKN